MIAKEQRRQVVELLRCAAYLAATGDWSPYLGCGPTAARRLGTTDYVNEIATQAICAVSGRSSSSDAASADAHIAECLEAALRVERRWWWP